MSWREMKETPRAVLDYLPMVRDVAAKRRESSVREREFRNG